MSTNRLAIDLRELSFGKNRIAPESMRVIADELDQLEAQRDAARSVIDLFLQQCRCVDIHHNGFGRVFDAAMAEKNARTKVGV